ncbi:DUF4426 domain-containing protein [Paraglaciecola hydrolytica]|uniref:DUF4426 domain-containing protein n=1 Tax=Paraglaciecola hydrolytica TaxID=1799789 RepID=A0A148KMK5_9ALTE|nr:DUF4426 domain-containing protein [Paraglaciecola hydrolytica]KXI27527.1 hypothetical protein AX660_21905 [Paraglaciecola hydrolytica]
MSVIFAALTLFAFASKANAEQKVALGTWDVHYIAFNTTFLTPEIAKNNGIVRSKYNALINISVLDKKSQAAQNVILSGEARNLLGVTKKLSFKQVKEGEAIYYLAVLPFSDQEHYRINVDINDGKSQQKLKFEHKFYVE